MRGSSEGILALSFFFSDFFHTWAKIMHSEGVFHNKYLRDRVKTEGARAVQRYGKKDRKMTLYAYLYIKTHN